MVSFDSFGEMYKFARELDEGIKCLEDKLKNPEQLRYGDKKANHKANLCLDTLEEEILIIQAEVGELIQRETEELQLLTEERDEYAMYVKNIEAGIDDYKSILEPYGYKHRQPKESTPLSSASMVQRDYSLLENESGSLVHRDNSTDIRNHHMYNSQNSVEFENYSTPDLFKRPTQRNENNGMHEFSYTAQDYDATFPDGGRMKPKKDDDSKLTKPNSTLLSQTFLYTPSDSKLSNVSRVNTTFTDKKKLINDIKTPKTNKMIYKSVPMSTPPDPGFSSLSLQIYRLNMGRHKQMNKENETEN